MALAREYSKNAGAVVNGIGNNSRVIRTTKSRKNCRMRERKRERKRGGDWGHGMVNQVCVCVCVCCGGERAQLSVAPTEKRLEFCLSLLSGTASDIKGLSQPTTSYYCI